VAVDRDLAQIDVMLARGGHADMRSRVAVAAAEAATWCRAHAAARGYILAAADADIGTDDLHMRPHVAAVGLRLAAEWSACDPVTEPERQALTRAMLALLADPGCRNAPGSQARAYLRTAEAEASRLTGPGDPDLWRAAAQAWEQIPAAHRIAYAQVRQAEALLACRGQRQQAQAALAAGRETALRLRARVLAEEAGNLAARARLEPSAASEPGPADRFGLTQREREVLGLVCAGATNRQIAEQLFISPKTAGLHVSHILAKLGVATRGEAAALAYRLGLAVPVAARRRSAQPADRDI
jgi:DNA-binding CsgD family transcriptional regulator